MTGVALHRRPVILLSLLWLLVQSISGASIEYTNCLDSSKNASRPQLLQFVPLYVNASFDTKSKSHGVNITVYGNVTGQQYASPLPPPSDPYWSNSTGSNNNNGKIANVSDNSITTLKYRYNFLTYTPYTATPGIFCDYVQNGTECPLAPIFPPDGNRSAVPYYDLRSFAIGNDMNSSFRFATLASTIDIITGQQNPQTLGCISVNITPDIGRSLARIVGYIPVVVLGFVALATVGSAVFSPWGTINIFKWTSNYSRDRDLLRLVTPGFGDCIQYIQFVILAGSLSLNYPGYFQPVVSQVSWSILMFNESFVSHGNGTQSLVDGIYVTSGNYGLSRMRQLVGMSADDDVWAGMVVWSLVIIGAIIVICQLGFLGRWMRRTFSDTPGEELRSLNWPFTAGNVVRVVCIYFLLPIVSLSMFQLVIAPDAPAFVTALAVILLVAILAFAGWILKIILTAQPRSHLFDDLQTVLLYGPLYNTYSDEAAPFALIPALLTFIRAIAVGAIQPSGIVQIVVLAICEVILILTLHAFRPFRSQTSMNAYHTFFSSARLAVILLSIAFVPQLGVTEGTKGWIGYAILLIHAIVMVLGFLLSSIQRLFEVTARLLGAGGDEGTGAATRGDLVKAFGMRQLSRRARRPDFRRSMNSDAAMLTDDGEAFDNKSAQFGGRSRSLSASSAILLNQRSTPERLSNHLDRTESSNGPPDTPADYDAFNFFPEGQQAVAGASRKPDLVRRNDPAGPYYRAPRQRRPTGDFVTPGAKSRASWVDASGVPQQAEGGAAEALPIDRNASVIRPMSVSPENKMTTAVAPPYTRNREGSDPILNDARRPNVDYAVREVDFYYGVRGPALSNTPTRKLKTGPADPVGPVSSATGWFKGIFGKKTKDSGKGFEVVRSTRAPPQGFSSDPASPTGGTEPYHDTPPAPDAKAVPGRRTRSNDDDREFDGGLDGTKEEAMSSAASDDNTIHDSDQASYREQVGEIPPTLDPIDIGGGSLGIPSRVGSNVSTASRVHVTGTSTPRDGRPPPSIPRRSSKRESQSDMMFDPVRLSTVPDIEESRSSIGRAGSPATRVPFSGPTSPADAGRRSIGAESALSMEAPDPDTGFHIQHRPGFSQVSLAPPEDIDRPTSVNYVRQYRASDGITQHTDGPHAHAGTSAEVVNSSRRHSDVSDVSDT